MNDSNWWNPNFRYRLPIILFDTIAVERIDEPVRLDLVFDVARPHPNGLRLIDSDGQAIPFQVVRQGVGADGKLEYASLYFLATLRPNDPNHRYYIYLNENDPRPASFAGIERLEPQLADGFRRLDTGHYILELCCGTAEGHGGSKWGIRHFEEKEQGLNLRVSNMNAFGGVYGPFFTLENGCTHSEHRRIQINLRADRGSPMTEDDRDSYDGGYDTGVMAEVVDHLESVDGPRTCHGCHKQYLLKEADTGYMGNLCYECDPEDEPASPQSVCECANFSPGYEQPCDHCQRYLADQAEYDIWCGVPEPQCSCNRETGLMCYLCAEEYDEPCRSCGVNSQLWTDEKHCRQCFINLHGYEFPRTIEVVD